MNLGLTGTIAITRQGKAHSRDDPTPQDVDQEFVFLFTIFNEENDEESGLKDTIKVASSVIFQAMKPV